jgi:circadian clock protein KaiC
VLKSRGMAHSNQIREFRFTGEGFELAEVYLGPSGVLTGSARLAQEALERSAAGARRQEIERKQRALQRRNAVLEAQIAALNAEFEREAAEIMNDIREAQAFEGQVLDDRGLMAQSRQPDSASDGRRRSAKRKVRQ